MLFGILYLLLIIGLLIYMNFALKDRSYYVESLVVLLRSMILLLFWVFYMPFYESFISILRCNSDGTHYLVSGMQCFQGIHIFYVVVCIFFLLILISVSVIIAMLYNETQPVQEDCLSRLETSFEVALVAYRSIVATYTNFCSSNVCSWILVAAFIITSGMLCY